MASQTATSGTHREAVVFDLDGTLIDSAPDIHAASNALLAEDGLPALTFDQIRSFIGKGVPQLVTRILETIGDDPTGPRHAALVHRFETRYETAVGLTLPYPGVVAALDRLAERGFVLGVCTNKPAAPARAVLAHLGLLNRFAAILGGDSLAVRKPDPAPLFATIAALGAVPERCLYVGDSEVDAETAMRAGIPFALYTEGYRKTPVAELPHRFAFGDFSRLPALAAEFFG